MAKAASERTSSFAVEQKKDLSDIYLDLVELENRYPDIPDLREVVARLYRLLY